MRPTIEDLKALQRERALGDVHVVYLDRRGFTIAHTDDERAAGNPLEQCELHEWLNEQERNPFHESGYYTVTPIEPFPPDARTPARPFRFEPLTAQRS